jgi:glycosyltransferase involved in cell wall biosynthesis
MYKMKILILLPLLKNTGPGNVVASLINSRAYKDHDIILCSLMGAETLFIDTIKNKKVKIIALPGFSFKSVIQLKKIIKDEKVNILHSHCLLPDIVAPISSLFTKCKTISTIHCDLKADYDNEYPFYKAKLYFLLHNIFLSLIKNRISVSSGVKAALICKSNVIYNGVKSRTLIKKPSEKINLIFAGRLIPRKNILFLLNAITTIQNSDDRTIYLHVYGEGEHYDDAVTFESSKIIIHGFNNDFIAQIPENSIFINPALAEGMPMAVLEAIAAEIPVVLSNIPPHAEIKKNIHSGVEIFEFTPESLLQAINRLTNNTAIVSIDNKKMTQNFKDCFSNEKMSKGYIDEYKNTFI